MANEVQLQDKAVLAHMGFFNRAARKRYRENSKEVCAAASSKDYVDVIELDIRKSSDGVLYCYHGNPLTYCTILKLPLPLAFVRKRYRVDTLAEVLDVISPHKSIFLDIKDTRVTRNDILRRFEGHTFKEIILGNKSVKYLDRFTDMPPLFVKILNGNIFCNFYDLQILRDKGFKYFAAVFGFQVNDAVRKKFEQNGVFFRISGFGFLTNKAYWRKIAKYKITRVTSDFIE